jgi:imidazoleglycerol phosphate synthase glutamine amidotransferase subunit HisH
MNECENTGLGWRKALLPIDATLKQAVPNNPDHCIANCLYGDVAVSATIGRDNIYGCQFHPEKSGKIGLKILHSFLSL